MRTEGSGTVVGEKMMSSTIVNVSRPCQSGDVAAQAGVVFMMVSSAAVPANEEMSAPNRLWPRGKSAMGSVLRKTANGPVAVSCKECVPSGMSAVYEMKA